MWLLKASSRQIDSETLLMRLPAFIAAHAGVALIGGAAGEDHRVGGRHMSVGPDEERDAAVDVVAGGHLLRGRLGMEIQHRGIDRGAEAVARSEEHTSELQSLMRTSYAVFCLKKKTKESLTSIYNDQ